MAPKRPHENTGNQEENGKRKKKDKVFNFAAHPKRKIAIQFFYLGWEHDGLVQQPNTENSVEHHVMVSLLKTHLIDDWTKCEFSRCGRTDKGVSAFRQTAALIVRSCCPDEKGVFWDDETDEETRKNYKSKDEELNYVKMLNGVLPKTIRAFAWAPADRSFNARFQCNRRSYKYAFPRADLDIEKIKDAASRLVGEHDYSNFCQIDMNEKRLEQSYIRKIYDVNIVEVSKSSSGKEYDILELTVDGSGFLWHMIRYIVTVLHEVGRGKEEPEIVTQMLDLSIYPSRPQYCLASDTPLCLFDCRYDNSNLQWKTDELVLNATIAGIQKTWAAYQSRSRMMENMLSELTQMVPDSVDIAKGLNEFVQDRPIPANYIKFADRPKCESLQSKRDKMAAIKKIDK